MDRQRGSFRGPSRPRAVRKSGTEPRYVQGPDLSYSWFGVFGMASLQPWPAGWKRVSADDCRGGERLTGEADPTSNAFDRLQARGGGRYRKMRESFLRNYPPCESWGREGITSATAAKKTKHCSGMRATDRRCMQAVVTRRWRGRNVRLMIRLCVPSGVGRRRVYEAFQARRAAAAPGKQADLRIPSGIASCEYRCTLMGLDGGCGIRKRTRRHARARGDGHESRYPVQMGTTSADGHAIAISGRGMIDGMQGGSPVWIGVCLLSKDGFGDDSEKERAVSDTENEGKWPVCACRYPFTGSDTPDREEESTVPGKPATTPTTRCLAPQLGRDTGIGEGSYLEMMCKVHGSHPGIEWKPYVMRRVHILGDVSVSCVSVDFQPPSESTWTRGSRPIFICSRLFQAALDSESAAAGRSISSRVLMHPRKPSRFSEYSHLLRAIGRRHVRNLPLSGEFCLFNLLVYRGLIYPNGGAKGFVRAFDRAPALPDTKSRLPCCRDCTGCMTEAGGNVTRP